MLKQLLEFAQRGREAGLLPTLGDIKGRPNQLSLPHPDEVISEIDHALKTLLAKPLAQRPNPSEKFQTHTQDNFSAIEKADIIGMMRVNHVGEVCAQALYQGQALAAKTTERKAMFKHAATEEADHLAWTQDRLEELGGRPSLLNPLWYAGAFTLGFVAGQFGDKVSLGFMAETERQVEQHLNGHLQRLPASDFASRAIVEQMKQDEIEHGQAAQTEGAAPLPAPVKFAMTKMAKLMTNLAHHI